MILIFFKRVLSNTWKNLWRNKLISLSSILVMGLIFFVFNIILHFNLVTDKILVDINEKLDISIDILEDASEFALQSLLIDLNSLDTIKTVEYISQDQALINFQKTFPDLKLNVFLEKFNESNPLPSSIVITVQNIENHKHVLDFLSQDKYKTIINIDRLTNNKEAHNRIKKLEKITIFIYKSGVFLNIIFVIITMLVIFNAIKMSIHYHQKEINIMRLVGAKFNFIRLPFLCMGAIFSFMAVLIGIGLMVFFHTRMNDFLNLVFVDDTILKNTLSEVLYSFQNNIFLIFSLELVLVFIFAFISSYFAIQMYLWKEENYL